MANMEKQLSNALRLIQNLQSQIVKKKEKTRKAAGRTAGTGSEAHLRLLSAVAKNQPLNAESFAEIAKHNGYAKGKGSGAAFRGRNATLKYIIRKEVILSKRGEQILLQARAKATHSNETEITNSPAVHQETNQPVEQKNEQVLETVAQDGK